MHWCSADILSGQSLTSMENVAVLFEPTDYRIGGVFATEL